MVHRRISRERKYIDPFSPFRGRIFELLSNRGPRDQPRDVQVDIRFDSGRGLEGSSWIRPEQQCAPADRAQVHSLERLLLGSNRWNLAAIGDEGGQQEQPAPP